MNAVLREITPITEKDCLYIVERHKSEFLYPLHSHMDFELNFIENGAGVKRVVGDSVEEIGEYELTLVAGEQLEHAWEQGTCSSGDVREITIQFAWDLFDGPGMNKNIFDDIHQMLQRARLGLTFSLKTIMRVYPQLDTLAHETEPFEQYMSFLKMMHELARAEDARVLASSSFARADDNTQSRRIKKVEQYISEHYAEDIRLEDLAALVGMAPSAFSRFFRQRTGRTVVDYIIDIRLGNAARMLVDTTQNISEICYSCGFNNLSNFNRVFKAKRGYTPRDFRTLFKKTKVFV